ncbi:MAG: hypothetical protein H0V07_11395, partial [Propionibacteriales bacterium]|nr:hypothetical protein [Propionibacteriales bacterium]
MRHRAGLAGAAAFVIAATGSIVGTAPNTLGSAPDTFGSPAPDTLRTARGAPEAHDVTRPSPGAIHVESLSSGGKAWFNGPVSSGGGDLPQAKAGNITFGTNVDANNPRHDLVAGQSETAIAADASTHAVVTAWNDATGFIVQPSTKRRASLTGLSVSTDRGRHFRDLIGLRNNRLNEQWFGDPTVVRIDRHHFVIGSLFLPPNRINCRSGHHTRFQLAVEVLTVRRDGRTALGKPVVAADGGDLCTLFRRRPTDPNLAFLDKEFLSYDRTSRQLAMSYTRFFFGIGRQSGLGQIELVRARVPADPRTLRAGDWRRPVTIWPEERRVVNT